MADATTAPASRNAARRRSSTWLGSAIVTLAFVTAAGLTWRKWPDALVDFGMQLYLPWKISHGLVLYRDAKYLTGGPFSVYFNAQLFKIFGASLMTLAFANLLIAAGLVALMYRRFLKVSDALTATLICLGVALVFAFNQYSDIGNYNYITPYSHEVWQGLTLSIAVIALMSSWATKEKIAFAACAGFCAGLVFMTKPDIFVALAAAMVLGFVSSAIVKCDARFLLKSLLAILFAGALPLLVLLFYFHQHEGWRESLRSVCFAWVPLFKSHVSETPFYKWCTGMDAPWLNARAMLVHFAVVCAVVAVSALLFRRDLSKSLNRLLALAWIGLLMALASGFDWLDCGRSLPLLDAVLLVALGAKFWKLRDAALTFPLLWSAFALMLLAKLGLYCRIWHYGFALAMPAFAAAIYLLLWMTPRWLEKVGVHRKLYTCALALVLFTGMARLFVQSQFIYRAKTIAIGSGADQFFAPNEKTNPAGAAVQTALDWLDHNTSTNATVAVLPEGIMLNYLSHRTNPGHYLLWNGNELAAFGQAEMTADFENHPPDYVILVHRDASEYGLKYFGQEEKFGLELMHWIRKNYEPVKLIGSEPLVNSCFGIQILRRAPALNNPG
jgi:hypothetical protein